MKKRRKSNRSKSRQRGLVAFYHQVVVVIVQLGLRLLFRYLLVAVVDIEHDPDGMGD